MQPDAGLIRSRGAALEDARVVAVATAAYGLVGRLRLAPALRAELNPQMRSGPLRGARASIAGAGGSRL
jgi:hypothetical protein